MSEFVRAAGTTEIKAGTGLTVEVNGTSLAIFNVSGTFHAIDNTCVHRGGPLGEGDLDGEVVTCPWHQWSYNVTTGKCINSPAACVKSYPVKIEGADITVQL